MFAEALPTLEKPTFASCPAVALTLLVPTVVVL